MAKRSRLLAEVPPFHPVAVRLLKLVGDPSVSLGQIVAMVRTDSVFTGEVLRLANSPLFGSRGEIKNVLQALAFLGLNRVECPSRYHRHARPRRQAAHPDPFVLAA